MPGKPTPEGRTSMIESETKSVSTATARLEQALTLCRHELAQVRQVQEALMEDASKLPTLRRERDEYAALLARQLSVAYWTEHGPAAFEARRTLRSRVRRMLARGRPDAYESALRLRWEHIELIEGAAHFDGGWYLRSYADVANSGSSPAAHYLLHGADERRNPGPAFDTAFYLRKYPDVMASGTNPLVHYVLFGASEGRSTAPERQEPTKYA